MEWRHLKRAGLFALCTGAGLVCVRPAAADERDLSQHQPGSFYLSHGVVAGSAIVSTALLYRLDAPEPRTGSWFGFEDSVEQHFSPTSASISDGFLLASVLVPLAAQTGSSGTQFGNTALIYGESVALSLWLNTAVKYSVRRARPETHNDSAKVRQVALERPDRNLSFYSGHASTAFTALVSGGLLFSSTHSDDPAARRAFWGAQAALAGATAHLRVRAGRHYYSDVVVGAVVGSALGGFVPYLSGVRYQLDGGDWAALAGGLVIGAGAALIAPSDDFAIAPSNALLPHVTTVAVVPSFDGSGTLFVARGVL